MKLLSIKTTLLFFSQNRFVQEPDGPSLQDCGDLMSWHLSVWLKQNPLAFDTFNRIEFCAVRPDIGDKVVVLDGTAYVSIAIHDPNQVKQATTDLEVFAILTQVVRAGVTLFDRHFGTGLSGFDRALSDLRDNQYVANDVLTSRNPKGKKLPLSIEAEMTSTVLNVYFVERQGEQELRRELIQNSLPSAIYLQGRFSKIEVDGNRAYLSKKLLKPKLPWRRRRPQEPLKDRLEYYMWSTELTGP